MRQMFALMALLPGRGADDAAARVGTAGQDRPADPRLHHPQAHRVDAGRPQVGRTAAPRGQWPAGPGWGAGLSDEKRRQRHCQHHPGLWTRAARRTEIGGGACQRSFGQGENQVRGERGGVLRRCRRRAEPQGIRHQRPCHPRRRIPAAAIRTDGDRKLGIQIRAHRPARTGTQHQPEGGYGHSALPRRALCGVVPLQ